MLASGLKALTMASLLTAVPAVAQGQAAEAAAPAAQRLSLSSSPAVRAGAPIRSANRALGGGAWIIGGIAMVAGVVYALVEADDDDLPASP